MGVIKGIDEQEIKIVSRFYIDTESRYMEDYFIHGSKGLEWRMYRKFESGLHHMNKLIRDEEDYARKHFS